MSRALWSRLRRDEAGITLPEVMVAIIINALVLGSIATGIVMFTLWQSSVVTASRTLAIVSGLETELRSGLAAATSVSVDGEGVLLIESWTTGECVQQWWHLDDGTITKSSADCGSASLVHQPVFAAESFTVSLLNEAGRAMSVVGGVVVLAAETPPSPTPEAWDSTRIGAVVLTFDERELVLLTGPATRLAGFTGFPSVFGGAS